MIPNSQPYAAVIVDKTTGYSDWISFLPIAAWREDGTPLAHYDGALCPVRTIPGYERIIVKAIGPKTATRMERLKAINPAVQGRDPQQTIRTHLTEED